MTPETVRIRWHDSMSDFGQAMPWFGSWLVGDGAVEGSWFHSGRGGGETAHTPPSDAVGVRLRFWPSEGLDPEYVDVPLSSDGGELVIDTAELEFDRPGPHSRLAERADRF